MPPMRCALHFSPGHRQRAQRGWQAGPGRSSHQRRQRSAAVLRHPLGRARGRGARDAGRRRRAGGERGAGAAGERAAAAAGGGDSRQSGHAGGRGSSFLLSFPSLPSSVLHVHASNSCTASHCRRRALRLASPLPPPSPSPPPLPLLPAFWIPRLAHLASLPRAFPLPFAEPRSGRTRHSTRSSTSPEPKESVPWPGPPH